MKTAYRHWQPQTAAATQKDKGQKLLRNFFQIINAALFTL